MEAKVPNKNGVLMNKYAAACVKLSPEVELPAKERITDVGWDITVISRDANRSEDVQGDVNVYCCGISFRPPEHYHFELYEHPSLHKAGYSLMGAPRIINPEDEDEVKIPLFKFKDTEDLALPFPAAVAVLKVTEYAVMDLVTPSRGVSAMALEEAMKIVEESRGGNLASNGSGRHRSSKLASSSNGAPSRKKNGHFS